MRPLCGRAGVSLVEVVVAITVLGVGLVGLLRGFGLGYRMIGQGSRLTRVAALAAERIEIARSAGCAALGNGFDVRGPFTVTWAVARTVRGRTARVTVAVTSPTARARRVDKFVSEFGCRS